MVETLGILQGAPKVKGGNRLGSRGDIRRSRAMFKVAERREGVLKGLGVEMSAQISGTVGVMMEEKTGVRKFRSSLNQSIGLR